MIKTTKILFTLLVTTCFILPSYADRGVSKKSRNKVSVNINTRLSLKSNLSGLKYNGSYSDPCNAVNQKETGNLITYQKGNAVYIIHAKQRTVFNTANSNNYDAVKVLIKAS